MAGPLSLPTSRVFVKLFSKILHSSVWSEDMPTRITWIALLAMADSDGFVSGADESLARMANVPYPDFSRSLGVLLGPDLKRPGQPHEGRRIERMVDGLLILNYPQYRAMKDPDVIREQTRERVRQHRARKQNVTHGNDVTQDVTHGNVKTEVRSQTEKSENFGSKSSVEPVTFDSVWKHYPRRSGGNPRSKAEKAWNARLHEGIQPAALAASVTRYRAFCQATNRIGTEYVMMGSTFFGPDSRWDDPWEAPAPGVGKVRQGKAGRMDRGLEAVANVVSQHSQNGKS